jgi:hypothetical protein
MRALTNLPFDKRNPKTMDQDEVETNEVFIRDTRDMYGFMTQIQRDPDEDCAYTAGYVYIGDPNDIKLNKMLFNGLYMIELFYQGSQADPDGRPLNPMYRAYFLHSICRK